MSVKKDRFNKRKYRNGKGHYWTVPKGWIRQCIQNTKAKNRQRMREGRFDFLPIRKDAGYDYW